MGVNIFLLDRRPATLIVAGFRQRIGTLRRYFKLTELTGERVAEIEAANRIPSAPAAALVADESELPLASVPNEPVRAHLVLGWDADRRRVTDLGWDYLPQLGYAVRNPRTHEFTLFEERGDLLYPIGIDRKRCSAALLQ